MMNSPFSYLLRYPYNFYYVSLHPQLLPLYPFLLSPARNTIRSFLGTPRNGLNFLTLLV